MSRFIRLLLTVIILNFFYIINSIAQPNADFSASMTNGCAPLLVQFQDLSTPAAGTTISSWSWDLGGTSSSTQTPGKVFTNGGQFTICLTVTDSNGDTDTECKTNYINVLAPPQVALNGTPLSGCTPLNVGFQDISIAGDGNITTWQWAFGDGTFSAAQNPSHVYANSGAYSVTLSVTDDNNCSDLITINDLVQATEVPIANFSAAQQSFCDTPFTVIFNDLSTTIGNPVSYLYDFGDGNTSTLPSPSHTYTTFGNFDVTLTITDLITGCSDTEVKTSFINIGSNLEFSFTPTQGCAGVSVDFTDDTPGSTSNWMWDFGDGFTSTDQNPTHTYNTPGCYFVSLTATADGCTSTKVAANCIQINPIPVPNYTSTNLLACDIPHTASFSGTSSIAGSTYDWDFGDGNTSTQQNPSHTYTSFGTFPIKLTVTSPQGCSDEVILDTVRVQAVQADFSGDTISGCSPLMVTFQDASTSLFPITSWNWQFLGGSFSAVSNLENPDITFIDTNTYQVSLVVTNSQGCMDSITRDNYVAVGFPPNVDFTTSDTMTCVDTDVVFDNFSDTFTDRWDWDFGDGGTSVATHPTHMYEDTGIYNITLVATHNGCSSTLEKPFYVNVQGPKAEFVHNRICNNPFNLVFNNLTIDAHRYHWDFGVPSVTNDTSNLENPTFTFPDRGTYQVVLTAFNDSSGCSHDYIETIIITDPISTFSIEPDSGCAPFTLNILNNSVDGNTYQWNIPGADNPTPSGFQPIVTFSNAGIYDDFELIVTDLNGCRDTIQIIDTVYVSDVYPNIGISDVGACIGEDISFTDNSTNFLGTINGWKWEFGDGDSSLIQNPMHNYDTTGLYSITLTTTNTWGCTRSLTLADTISITRPIVNFGVNDTLFCTEQDIQFTDSSTGFNITSWLWDFGDGNTSTDQNPIYQYTIEGNYTICLTVTDGNGCMNTSCQTNLVTIENPVANFFADTLIASCPILTVNFTDSSTNAISWQWDFGDGIGTSTVQNPTYTYVRSGEYDITLIVQSPSGCYDTITKTEYIIIDGPYGDFNYSIINACPNEPIQFTANAQNTSQYIWDFGNGDFVINNSTDTTDTINYAYTSGGSYLPILILIGSQGCQEIIAGDNIITVDDITVDIIASDTAFCDSGTVTLQPVLTSSIPIDSFVWTFNGAFPPSNDTTVTLNLTTPGVYTVTLTAFNAFCPNFHTQEIIIGGTPTANFSATPLIGCTPQEVNFVSTSSSNSFPGDTVNTWNWDFDWMNMIDSVANPTISYPDSGIYQVSLIVSSTQGCSDTITNPVQVNLTPTANAGADAVVCLNGAVQLQGSGGVTYSWSPSATLSCDNCANPIASPNTTTTYTLTVTSAEGCTNTDQVTVTVLPFQTPQVTVTPDTTICQGDVIQLIAGGGTSVLQYSWDQSRAGLSCYTNCNNPFASPDTTTTYLVTLTSIQGCSATDSVTVSVIDESQDILGPDLTICKGDSILLNPTVGTNHVWSPTTGLSCVFCSNPFAFPDATTDYVVTATTATGCNITDTITINVFNPTSVNAGADLGTCQGNTIQLNGSGVGTVTWTGDASISDPTILNPMVTPTGDTEYILSITNGNCTVSDTVSVFLVTEATISAEDITICKGESVQLTVGGFAQSYEWTPTTSLDNANIKEPIATPDDTTTYTVTGSITGCPSATTTLTVNVLDVTSVVENPIQNVFAGNPTPIRLSPLAGNTNLSFSWSPNVGLTCDDCYNPLVNISFDTTYVIQIIDNEFGCVGTDSIQIKVVNDCTDNLVVVPNAFTPNGDGLNDRLYVRGSALTAISMFRIYSRTGELVFETSDINDGWDGTFNGKQLNTGVFVYYVDAPCPLTGSSILKKGNVTLLR